MKSTILTNFLRPECYVLEIDGKIKSEYGIFTEALKAGLELKQKYPHSEVKVHDGNEKMPTELSKKSENKTEAAVIG